MTRSVLAGSVTAALVFLGPPALRPVPVTAAQAGENPRAFLQAYCITCHSQQLKPRGTVPVALDTLDPIRCRERREDVGSRSCARCAPASCRRPACRVPTRRRTTPSSPGSKASSIARRASEPNPGRTEPFHRLNRTEYRNAVRDLLGLDVDVDGAAAARRRQLRLRQHRRRAEALADADRALSRGGAEDQPRRRSARRRRRRPSTTSAWPTIARRRIACPAQPFGTRGGTTIRYMFPMDAQYTIRVAAVARSQRAGADLRGAAAARGQHRRRAGPACSRCRPSAAPARRRRRNRAASDERPAHAPDERRGPRRARARRGRRRDAAAAGRGRSRAIAPTATGRCACR